SFLKYINRHIQNNLLMISFFFIFFILSLKHCF
ncbi:hypothetical protein, partial [Plasmodium yoelii yoelii]